VRIQGFFDFISICRKSRRRYTSGSKQLEWSFQVDFGAVFGFFVIFLRFGKLLQVMGEIDLAQDRRVNKTSCPEIAWN